jgi:hypothetical protein
MTSRNDITGDAMVSKTNTESYREGHDRIFKKRKTVEELIESWKEPAKPGSDHLEGEKDDNPEH